MKMMDGTNCLQCYFILASVPGFDLGIKPILNIGEHYSELGFRLRGMSAVKPFESNNGIISHVNFKSDMTVAQAFPTIKFHKNSVIRSSMYFSFAIPSGFCEVDKLNKFLRENQVTMKIINYVKAYLTPSVIWLDEEGITQAFSNTFNSALDKALEDNFQAAKNKKLGSLENNLVIDFKDILKAKSNKKDKNKKP